MLKKLFSFYSRVLWKSRLIGQHGFFIVGIDNSMLFEKIHTAYQFYLHIIENLFTLVQRLRGNPREALWLSKIRCVCFLKQSYLISDNKMDHIACRIDKITAVYTTLYPVSSYTTSVKTKSLRSCLVSSCLLFTSKTILEKAS